MSNDECNFFYLSTLSLQTFCVFFFQNKNGTITIKLCDINKSWMLKPLSVIMESLGSHLFCKPFLSTFWRSLVQPPISWGYVTKKPIRCGPNQTLSVFLHVEERLPVDRVVVLILDRTFCPFNNGHGGWEFGFHITQSEILDIISTFPPTCVIPLMRHQIYPRN